MSKNVLKATATSSISSSLPIIVLNLFFVSLIKHTKYVFNNFAVLQCIVIVQFIIYSVVIYDRHRSLRSIDKKSDRQSHFNACSSVRYDPVNINRNIVHFFCIHQINIYICIFKFAQSKNLTIISYSSFILARSVNTKLSINIKFSYSIYKFNNIKIPCDV